MELSNHIANFFQAALVFLKRVPLLVILKLKLDLQIQLLAMALHVMHLAQETALELLLQGMTRASLTRGLQLFLLNNL